MHIDPALKILRFRWEMMRALNLGLRGRHGQKGGKHKKYVR